MDLDAWGLKAHFPDLEGPSLQEAVEELCERRQALFLATPYLTFGSRFMAREGQVLRIRATMSRTVAQHTLAQKSLTLRFPWGPSLYGGPTRILDYLEEESGKLLAVALPPRFARDDQRRAYRVDQVGRSSGTLGSLGGDPAEGMRFVRFNVENVSTEGMGLFCTDPLPGRAFVPGRRVALEFTLEKGPELKATALIRHTNGQSIGLEFQPSLPPLLRQELSAWLQPRLDAALQRWEGRALLRAKAERAAAPRPKPSGILLVSGAPELLAEVGEALAGAQDVRAVPAVLAPYREALDLQPPYLVVLPCSGSFEECHLLRALVDKVPPACPVVVMNTGTELEPLRAFAKEVKATLSTDRARMRPVFFRRLVLGLIRRHWSLAV